MKCIKCGSEDFLEGNIEIGLGAGGGFKPKGTLGTIFSVKTIQALVCKECGHMDMFLEQEVVDKLKAKTDK